MLNVIAACRINAYCGKKPTIFSVPRLPSCSLGKKGASNADLESPFFSRNVLSLLSIVTSSLIILVAIPFTWSSGKKLLIPREQVRNPFSFFGDDTDTDTNLCDPFAVCRVLCFYIFEDSKISLPPPSPSQPAPCFCWSSSSLFSPPLSATCFGTQRLPSPPSPPGRFVPGRTSPVRQTYCIHFNHTIYSGLQCLSFSC